MTCACISAGNDILMIFASTGAILLMFVFNRVVGHGSGAQDFEGHLLTSRTIAGAVVCV